MRIGIHVTEKVKHSWPVTYWTEFIRKATKAGHEVLCFSGEPNVVIQLKNTKFFDYTHEEDNHAFELLATCDLYVGPVLRFHDKAKELGIKTVCILTSSFTGVGVKSTIPCAGCIESIGERPDCHWGDELCQWHVTPNDVLWAVEA
jgi:hypothetical protein